MIDWLLLALVLFAGSRLANISIAKTTYRIITYSTFFIVVTGTLLILNNPTIAAVSTSASNLLNSVGIGYPYAWLVKSEQFGRELQACYYLMFFGIIICSLTATTFEHVDMARWKEKMHDTARQIIALLILIAIFWFLLYSSFSLSEGVIARRARHFYNSQALLVFWQLILLIAARDSGKALRVIFEKTGQS